ncbi:reverse transcriptase domain-containing protein [Tanacetum coccineum]
MAPKRTSTSAAPAMTQAAIRKLVVDSVAAALEAQAKIQIGTPDKEKLLNCTEECKVKFAIGTLTEEALSWWNSFAQPIGIEEAYKITWGLPRSIEGNVTASKPQTLEEAITINQRLMDQNNCNNNNNSRNNDHQQQQNRRNCRNKGPTTRSNMQPVSVTCHACGEKGHYRNQCMNKDI